MNQQDRQNYDEPDSHRNTHGRDETNEYGRYEPFLHQHITQKRPKGWGLLELTTPVREYEKTHGGQDKLMKAFYTAMHAETGTNDGATDQKVP